AMGLFMAFIHLYQHGADALNQLPRRHRDLYYDRVLGLPPRPGRVEAIHLCLFPDSGREYLHVDGETIFLGGKASVGQDVSARLAVPVTLQPGQLTRVETLFCERHPLVFPEWELGVVSGLRHHVVSMDPNIPEEGAGTVPSRPLFGPSRRPADENADGDARVGFAFSDPVLAMAEGERSIRLTLAFAPLSPGAMAQLEKTLEALAHSRKEGQKGALGILFARAFLFSITTSVGWHGMEAPPMVASLDPPRLKVQFCLGRDVPAVSGWDPDIHGSSGPGDPGVPLIKAVLNPHTPVHLASLLAPLVLDQIHIKVLVQGARQLVLANQLGPLDPNLPFVPFGPLPRRGSYCVVGHLESAPKALDYCTLSVTWSDLPRRGFADHYRAYDQDVENKDFIVKMEALRDGQWLASTHGETHSLFESASGGRLRTMSRFSISDSSHLG
ncbi:MAG: hypothetical protein MI749_17215, partial [Desulfovibrionales bacterium]|nr:hypothetical protein [Desulfovibrionales bacterium]